MFFSSLFSVFFVSVKPLYSIICEGQQRIISCQNGKLIDVLDANYGRLNRDTCLHPAMSNINCRSSNSLQIVKDKCNGKTSCQLIAANSEFGGDPCPGTYRYLEVKYKCLEYVGRQENNKKYKREGIGGKSPQVVIRLIYQFQLNWLTTPSINKHFCHFSLASEDNKHLYCCNLFVESLVMWDN